MTWLVRGSAVFAAACAIAFVAAAVVVVLAVNGRFGEGVGVANASLTVAFFSLLVLLAAALALIVALVAASLRSEPPRRDRP
jgi:hypothetical protein